MYTARQITGVNDIASEMLTVDEGYHGLFVVDRLSKVCRTVVKDYTPKIWKINDWPIIILQNEDKSHLLFCMSLCVNKSTWLGSANSIYIFILCCSCSHNNNHITHVHDGLAGKLSSGKGGHLCFYVSTFCTIINIDQ